MTQSQAILDAGLHYAQRGWPVIPLRGKVPLTRHGCKDASTDQETIRRWWSESPNANIGIATGSGSGLVVLDVDGEAGERSIASLVARHGQFPDTLEAATGRGRHLFFRVEGFEIRNDAGRKLGPGLDIRGEGGYVVAPPSQHDNGNLYRWTREVPVNHLPGWLHEKLATSVSAQLTSPETHQPIHQGARNSTLTSMAGKMRRHGFEPGEIEAALIVANHKRCNPPLPEDEVRGIAQSVGRYAPARNAMGTPTVAAVTSSTGPLDRLSTPSWPEALASEAFRGLAGEIVCAIEPHSEADPAALLLQFLAAFGNVIGRGPFFLVEQHPHYSNLFVLVVGVTAKSRKGTSWSRIAAIFEAVDPFWVSNRVHGGIGSGEGIIWAVRDAILKGDKLVDEGVDDKRLMLLETEFALPLSVIKREGSTVSECLRRAWDGTPLQTLTKNNPARATGAHISTIGHVTREELLRHLSETEIANGFGTDSSSAALGGQRRCPMVETYLVSRLKP